MPVRPRSPRGSTADCGRVRQPAGVSQPLLLATLITALLLGATALTYGIAFALSPTGSGDFQWGGAHLVVQGVDPYRAFLDGHFEWFVTSGHPNYAPLLLLALAPFGMLTFATGKAIWLGCNLVMLGVSIWIVFRHVGLTGQRLLVAAGLVAAAGPVAIALRGGQQTILVLFAAVLALQSRHPRRAALGAALAVTKYSFAPLLLGLPFSRSWRVVGWAAGIELAGTATFVAITGASLRSAFLGPLLVADGMAQGTGSVYTVVRLVTGSAGLALAAAGLLTGLLAWFGRRALTRGDWVDQLAVGATISLLTFPHLIYDYTLLLPVAAAGLRQGGRRGRVVLGCVAVVWFAWVLGGIVLVSPNSWLGIAETAAVAALSLACLRNGSRGPERPHSARPRLETADDRRELR